MSSGTRAALLGSLLAGIALTAGSTAGTELERRPDDVRLQFGERWLQLEVCADDVVRVAYAADPAFFDRRTLAAAAKGCGGATWEAAERGNILSLTTSRLDVRLDRTTGAVGFFDRDGTPILRERADGRTLTPAIVQGERTFSVRQQWEARGDESLYGLGQHQLGLWDIKGHDLELWQHNATVAVPVLVSSAGYGLFWDNTSLTRFGDLRRFEPIPASALTDADGEPGAFTGAYFAGAAFEREVAMRRDPTIDIEIPGGTKDPNLRIHPELPAEGDVSVRWEGTVEAPASGAYQFQTFSQAGVKLWIDDRLVIDHWKQGWLPWYDVAKVRFDAGTRHRLRLEWRKDQGIETMRLLWKTPAPDPSTSLWSEVGDGIDYYFFYGPSLDRVVAGYRRVTGDAPLPPLWAFGFWQSRERYRTARESLDVLTEFRRRGLPIDVIVQDWQYWKEDEWGSHAFDPARFPDPAGWVRTIHDEHHAKLLISVWGKFYPGTANFEALRTAGALYESPLGARLIDWLGHPYTFYDAYHEKGRTLFWQQLERDLFRLGVDAWWMDATEPDLVQPMPTLQGLRDHMHPTALGTAARMLNAYSLYNSASVFDGQRRAAPAQRVVILTRSGFAGQQRYGATTWSGDITSTWTSLQKQIPAGLSFSLSGLPYWTVDIGGFAPPPRFARDPMTPADREEWRELYARWYQYGAFLPLFRAHGQFPHRELFNVADESHPAYRSGAFFARLRYRLLPYLYAVAADVTLERGTMLRPLVMDFPGDDAARQVGNQFLLGPALLVAPVTAYKARTRSVYLPAGGWYDLWSGRYESGGGTVLAPAPLESLPVYVRAGSIVPMGPDLQYAEEKPAEPLTLHVYGGADGSFALYEDDGRTTAYERGDWSRIAVRWEDATRTLTVEPREGAFVGLPERTFEVVLHTPERSAGFSWTPGAARTLTYRGERIVQKL